MSKYEGFKITGDQVANIRKQHDGMARFCAQLMMDYRNMEQLARLSLKMSGEELRYERHCHDMDHGTGKFYHSLRETLEEVTDCPLAALEEFDKQ